MEYICFNKDFELPQLQSVNYFGKRSENFPFQTKIIERNNIFDNQNSEKVSKENIEEIKSLYAINIGVSPLFLVKESFVEFLKDSFENCIIFQKRKGKFSKNCYYGNNSFGEINDYENFYLKRFIKEKPSSILCFEEDCLVGACAIILSNLDKKGFAVVSYNNLNPMEIDCITFLSKNFSQTFLTNKMVIFIDFIKNSKETELFHENLRFFFEKNKNTCLFEKNLIEDYLKQTINKFKKK